MDGDSEPSVTGRYQEHFRHRDLSALAWTGPSGRRSCERHRRRNKGLRTQDLRIKAVKLLKANARLREEVNGLKVIHASMISLLPNLADSWRYLADENIALHAEVQLLWSKRRPRVPLAHVVQQVNPVLAIRLRERRLEPLHAAAEVHNLADDSVRLVDGAHSVMSESSTISERCELPALLECVA